MTVQVLEHIESQSLSGGQRAEGERVWIVRGTADSQEAYDAVKAASPTTWLDFARGTIRIEPLGPDIWRATVEYRPAPRIHWQGEPGDGGAGNELLDEWSFSISTATAHRELAINTQRYGNYTDYGHQIAVDENGKPHGVDYFVPTMRFSERHRVNATLVTEAWVKARADQIATTNNAAFRGFPAGEVLFLGLQGNRTTLDEWELEWEFAREPNVTLHVTIDGIDVDVPKKGWEYVWFEYRPDVASGVRKLVLKAAHVNQIYESSNFALLFPT